MNGWPTFLQSGLKISRITFLQILQTSKIELKGNKDAKFDWSRTCGPDPRDPRRSGAACFGSHGPAVPGRGSPSGSNAHATWTACARCKLRLSCTPSWGAHALTRKPGALPTPCRRGEAGRPAAGERGLQPEASGQGHRFGRSREELPQPTREDQGAESGLQQGQAGSRSTDRGPYHAMLPGRKGRKTESAEELEAKQREETVDSPGSFTVISS